MDADLDDRINAAFQDWLTESDPLGDDPATVVAAVLTDPANRDLAHAWLAARGLTEHAFQLGVTYGLSLAAAELVSVLDEADEITAALDDADGSEVTP